MPTCEKVTLTPQKRRLHLIDKHGYPRSYYFQIVETGQGKRMSLLKGGESGAGRRRRVSDVGEAGWRDNAREKKGTTGGRTSASTEVHEEEGVDGSDAERDGEDGGRVKSGGNERDAKDAEKGPMTRGKPIRAEMKRKPDDGVDELVNSVAALKFVPLSVRLKDMKSAS